MRNKLLLISILIVTVGRLAAQYFAESDAADSASGVGNNVVQGCLIGASGASACVPTNTSGTDVCSNACACQRCRTE